MLGLVGNRANKILYDISVGGAWQYNDTLGQASQTQQHQGLQQLSDQQPMLDNSI